jgi:hypothetical protein
MNLQGIFETPDLFLHSFEEPNALFLEMDRDAYFRSIFTDRRISPKNANQHRARCTDLFAEMESVQPQPICYIFHIAHCGSTLLARALDLKEENLVCREPFSLRQLGVRAAHGGGGEFDRQVRLARTMLGRRYNPAGPVIVKANVPVNCMIPALMQPAPDQPAIFLYYALEDYLLAILRSPMHRGWVQHVSDELRPGIEALTGPRVADESAAVMAARLWLTQMLQFEQALGAYPNARSLCAEDLFESPSSTLAASFSHFGQAQSAQTVAAIVQSDLFTRYSKDPKHQFDNAQRVERRAKLKVELAPELDVARAWVIQQPAAGQLPARLAKPLAGDGCVLLG